MAKKCNGNCASCGVVLNDGRVKALHLGSGLGIRCTSKKRVRSKISVHRERSGKLTVAT